MITYYLTIGLFLVLVAACGCMMYFEAVQEIAKSADDDEGRSR
jgi:hypothetical protein